MRLIALRPIPLASRYRADVARTGPVERATTRSLMQSAQSTRFDIVLYRPPEPGQMIIGLRALYPHAFVAFADHSSSRS